MAASSDSPPQQSSLSFTQGFLLGQLSISLLIFAFIKFFIFGEAPPSDVRASERQRQRHQRTVSHHQQHQRRASHHGLRQRRSANFLSASSSSPPAASADALTPAAILAKTYYNVSGHQPESLDWFNVLVAQTIAQLRADARRDGAVAASLGALLNDGGVRPEYVGEIRITEVALGEDFPIFSNCRVIPVEDAARLQARMDVDLSDVITLGVETTLALNYPKPLVAVLPVALAVSVVRFSGTLTVSFIPSSDDAATTLAFTFLDDYRLDLSVRSLVGSRSRLQDVPKIAQLVEARVHAWFDERCVEPRFQQIVLPSLWPRKRNTRGGGDDDVDDGVESSRGAEADGYRDGGKRKSASEAGRPRKGDGGLPVADETAHRMERLREEGLRRRRDGRGESRGRRWDGTTMPGTMVE